jgi:endonuclease V-like protein UPF0215 family
MQEISMNLHVHKKAFRSLGIAESFLKGGTEESILAGVVMRADFVIDGFVFSNVKIGGMDSTKKVIEMFQKLKRNDINLLLLNGCIISWYNVIDLYEVFSEIGLPLICVTYKNSQGLEKYFRELFPNDWDKRVKIYNKNKKRIPIIISSGYKIFIRIIGLEAEEAKVILNKFTTHGRIPEPLRVSRLLARTIMREVETRKTKKSLLCF